MKKRIIVILLTMIMLFSSVTVVFAAPTRIVYYGFVCNITSDSVVSVYDYTGDESVFNYDDWHEFSMFSHKDIARIEDSAFEGYTGVTRFSSPDSLTYIGPEAFKNCTNLEYIYIPEGVTSIGKNAFAGCTSLREIKYGGGKYQWSQLEKAGLGIPSSQYYVSYGKKVNHFVDVSPSDYYYDAVTWAYYKDITAGTTETQFSPYKGCTRAEVVSFLWRYAGCPVDKSETCPFVDVDKNSYYYDAVVWAYNRGIAAGVSENRFSPNTTVTRSQFVSFLHRLRGDHGLESEDIFLDVPQNAYYAKAVTWAHKYNITSGIGEGMFGPLKTCTRSQCVALLYRYNNAF